MTVTAVLSSGGLDSGALLAHMSKRGPVYPIYIRSGLPWEDEEILALKEFSKALVSGREKSVFMERGEISEFKISLQATGNLFKIGHRIRLDISSSSFPQFDVNPNTGDPLWSSDKVIKAYQIIYHSMDYPSKVILPVISRG